MVSGNFSWRPLNNAMCIVYTYVTTETQIKGQFFDYWAIAFELHTPPVKDLSVTV